MKKSIQMLASKLETSKDGKITGGFSSIKGGLAMTLPSQNDGCPNSGTCSGTNTGCTNGHDCSKSTNTVTACTNSNLCFY